MRGPLFSHTRLTLVAHDVLPFVRCPYFLERAPCVIDLFRGVLISQGEYCAHSFDLSGSPGAAVFIPTPLSRRTLRAPV